MARYPDDVQILLQKEMTRKEFLATLGFALLSLFGAGRFLSLFLRDKPVPNSDLMTYGSGKYSIRHESK